MGDIESIDELFQDGADLKLLCNVLFLDSDVYQEVFNQFNSTADPLKSELLLNSLFCVQDLHKMVELLSRSLKDDQLIGPHVCTLLETLSAHRYGHSIAEDYLDAFWNDFVARCPIMGDSFRKILLNLGEYNLSHRSSVSNWIGEKIGANRISPILQNFFIELEKKTDEKVLWQKNTQQFFVCWLRQYYHTNSSGLKCET